MISSHLSLLLHRQKFKCRNGCGAVSYGFTAPDGWFPVDIKGAYENRGGTWRGYRDMIFCSWQCVQEGVSNLSQPKGGRQKSKGKEEKIMVIHKRVSGGWDNSVSVAKCDSAIVDPKRMHVRWVSVTCKRCLKSAPVAVTA